jgi:serine/threonine protein kinase
MTGQTGSRRYMAPEVAQDRHYNKSVDVYSFGMLLWEMCMLEKPFHGYTSKKHMTLVVLGGERPPLDSFHCPYWPAKLQDLIKHCWCSNPHHRPTFSEVKTELAKIMECCASCPGRIQGHVAGTTNTTDIPAAARDMVVPSPPVGGFGSMKPAAARGGGGSRTRSVGDAPTTSTTSPSTTLAPPEGGFASMKKPSREPGRRHWTLGFVLKSHPSPPSSP